MKFKLTSLFLTIIFSQTAFSQDYKTGVGVRLQPYFNCITVKHFFNSKIAAEGLLNASHNQAVIETIAEFSNSFEKQKGLKWYYGLGGNVKIPENKPTIIGAVGILGLEYTFFGAPICSSLDWKPSFEIINGEATYPAGFGLSVRFVFGQKKDE